MKRTGDGSSAERKHASSSQQRDHDEADALGHVETPLPETYGHVLVHPREGTSKNKNSLRDSRGLPHTSRGDWIRENGRADFVECKDFMSCRELADLGKTGGRAGLSACRGQDANLF